MTFNPTRQQRDAINAEGCVLVCAAAGSGKTAVLVERVMRKLLDDERPVDADELLIVTFTNAAAAEMRARLETRLAQECLKQPHNSRLLRQQLLLGRASICTIDAFCVDLLRAHFQAAGIDADFRVADPSAVQPVSEAVLADVFGKRYAAGDEAFYALLLAVQPDGREELLKDYVLKLYQYSRAMPFPRQWLTRAAAAYDTPFEASEWAAVLFEDAALRIEQARQQVLEAIGEIENEDAIGPAYLPSLRATAAGLEAMNAAVARKDWSAVAAAGAAFSPVSFGRLLRYPDAARKERVKLARDKGRQCIERLARQFACGPDEQQARLTRAGGYVRTLVELVEEYAAAFDDAMRRRGMLSFDQIEHAALALLCEWRDGAPVPTAVAEEYSARFNEVLVDEYQDVNDLQDAIFQMLSGGGKRLFLVGDVKQSIYGFRQANPDLFLRRQTEWPPYDGASSPSKIQMSGNFRSRPEVCRYINACFGALMRARNAGLDYGAQEALDPLGTFAPRQGLKAEFLLAQEDETHTRDEAEANAIAAYIKTQLENGGASDYGDFAILLRAPATRAEVYLRTLRAQGIPALFDASGFLEAAEIMTMLSFLQAVDNPTRDIPLLAALYSPLLGFTPDRLAQLRIDRPEGSLYAALCACASTDEDAADALRLLKDVRCAAVTRTVADLIDYAYETTGYADCVRAMPDGERRVENLRLLRAYAAQYQDNDGKDLGGFLRWLDKLGRSGSLKAAGCAGEQAVRIMSIHAAKGLQFPHCIIAAGSARFQKRDSTAPLIMHREGGVALKYVDQTNVRCGNAAHAAVSILCERQTLAEELRLLYVAMTRAQDKLVLLLDKARFDNAERLERPPLPGELLAANSYIDWLLLADGTIPPDCRGVVQPPPANVLEASAQETGGQMDLPLFCEPQEQPPVQACETSKTLAGQLTAALDYTYPYEPLSAIASKYAVSALSEQAVKTEYSFTARPAFLSNQGLTPAERGTAAHLFMQYADFDAARKDARSELERLVEWEYLTPAQAQAIDLGKMEAFFKSSLFSRIQKAERVDREQRFLTELPAARLRADLPEDMADEPVVIQGVADCVFVEAGRLYILDFKTDGVADAAILLERYGEQLRFYGAALSEIYRLPLGGLYLYAFEADAVVEVPFEAPPC